MAIPLLVNSDDNFGLGRIVTVLSILSENFFKKNTVCVVEDFSFSCFLSFHIDMFKLEEEEAGREREREETSVACDVTNRWP